jgi:hypothetical protein
MENTSNNCRTGKRKRDGLGPEVFCETLDARSAGLADNGNKIASTT